MKKALLSIALMLMGLSAGAQVWEKTLEEGDQLVTKWDNCMMELTDIFRVAEASESLWGKKTTKGCREVVPYLLNEKGYVRIILPTSLGPEFDFKVPCIHNESK